MCNEGVCAYGNPTMTATDNAVPHDSAVPADTLILTNDKVKNGRVTKLKVEVSEIVEEEKEVEK